MPSHIKLVHLLFPILSDSLPIVDFSYDCLMDTDLILQFIRAVQLRLRYNVPNSLKIPVFQRCSLLKILGLRPSKMSNRVIFSNNVQLFKGASAKSMYDNRIIAQREPQINPCRLSCKKFSGKGIKRAPFSQGALFIP